MLTAAVTAAAASTTLCSKCGPNNAGKLTCCFPGGSWEGKCGNKDNSNFDHSWSEGVQACEVPALVEAQALAVAPNQEARTHLQKTTNSIMNGYMNAKEEHDRDSANSKHCDKSLIFVVANTLLVTTLAFHFL